MTAVAKKIKAMFAAANMDVLVDLLPSEADMDAEYMINFAGNDILGYGIQIAEGGYKLPYLYDADDIVLLDLDTRNYQSAVDIIVKNFQQR